MARIFLVGATGGVGSRLIPKLIAAGHKVTGLHRKDEQAKTLADKGADPLFGDLMDMTEDDFVKQTAGHDIIVFSAGAAGAGQDKTDEIDGETPKKLANAAQKNGIDRMYVVSVIPDAGRDRDTNDGFEFYMKKKREADNFIVRSGVPYVILRPGTLTDDNGTGHVSLDRAVAYGEVSRDNVAKALFELIEMPNIQNDIFELVDGGTEAKDAVQALAA